MDTTLLISVLVAIISGFIGGILGSMILHEILMQRMVREAEEDAKRDALLNHKVERVGEQYNAVTVALETLTHRMVRERGALWESVNGLWNSYDQMTAEGTQEGDTGMKQNETENDA